MTASGSRPPPRRGRNDGIADIAELTALCRRELHDSPAYPDLRPKDAVTARTEFLTAAGTPRPNEITYSLAGLDAARCERQARAVGMKALRGFMTATAKVLGVPKLRPGMHVHVVGLRPPFDGFYYVVKTVHTLDASGYVTDLTLERPGMLPPSAYMPATPPAQGTTTGGSP